MPLTKNELRRTTPEDVEQFLGRPLPYRARAYTGLVDGVIQGIGGIAYLPDGTALAFLHLADGATRFKMALHKAALLVLDDAKRRGIRQIAAEADPSHPTAERWLKRLGFEPVTLEGKRVFLWRHSHH